MKRSTALSIILLLLCAIAAGYLYCGTNGIIWGGLIGAALVGVCFISAVIYTRLRAGTGKNDADMQSRYKLNDTRVPHCLTDANAGSALKATAGSLKRRNAHRPRIIRPLLTDGGFTSESASHIKRFICYRTPEQTLIFVRLRAGKLYCMYMNRQKKSNGTRWVVRKIEGEEYGAISEKLMNMAHAIDY